MARPAAECLLGAAPRLALLQRRPCWLPLPSASSLGLRGEVQRMAWWWARSPSPRLARLQRLRQGWHRQGVASPSKARGSGSGLQLRPAVAGSAGCSAPGWWLALGGRSRHRPGSRPVRRKQSRFGGRSWGVRLSSKTRTRRLAALFTGLQPWAATYPAQRRDRFTLSADRSRWSSPLEPSAAGSFGRLGRRPGR